MRLETKRAIKAAEDGWLLTKQGELRDLCGSEVSYVIDWPSFDGDSQGMNWLEFNGPQQISNAFRIVGTDELGQEALRSVKKIMVKNVPEVAGKNLAFSDGVLSLECAFAKSPEGRFSDQDIAQCLLQTF